MSSSLMCPITQSRFVEPVTAPSGYTYEQAAILEWLENHHTDPMTRGVLAASDLVPNRALMDLLAEEKEETESKAAGSAPAPTHTPLPSTFTIGQVEHKDPATGDACTVVIPEDTPVTGLPSTNLVFVVDTSGSMSAAADINGEVTHSPLSVMDLAAHAVKTGVRVLRRQDSVGVVQYSSSATVCSAMMPVVGVTAHERIDSNVDRLQAGGQTNIYDGLRRAVVMLDEYIDSGRLGGPAAHDVIILLTDGQANHSPPRGEVEATRRLLAGRKSERPLTIHTIGFGSNQDEHQLSALAMGGGRYAYVSDAGMLCTTIGNLVAGALTTIATAAHDGSAICAGQPRVLLAGSTVVPLPGTTVSTEEEKEHDIDAITNSHGSHWQLVALLTELLTINSFGLVVDKSATALRTAATTLGHDDDRENLREIFKAVETGENWGRWGRRYIIALRDALEITTTCNARDAATKRLGGTAYAELVEGMNTIFEALPPPTGSRASSSYCRGYGGYGGPGSLSPQAVTRSIDMSAYNDMDGGCIDANSVVWLGYKTPYSPSLVSTLRPGMTVMGFTEEYKTAPARVIAVLFNPRPITVIDVAVNGHPDAAMLTPYHPYLDLSSATATTWAFPSALEEQSHRLLHGRKARAGVYSVLLESGFIGLVIGVTQKTVAATLGHGVITDPNPTTRALVHPFFGDRDAVTANIKILPPAPGKRGVALVTQHTRTRQTGLVTGWA